MRGNYKTLPEMAHADADSPALLGSPRGRGGASTPSGCTAALLKAQHGHHYLLLCPPSALVG